MKTYWQNLIIFLFPVFLLLFAMEIMLRRIPNDYSFKNERLIRDGEAFRVLVLGSSHAYKGVDPDSLGPGGFNAANISQDLGYDRAMLEHYLPCLPKLKYVLLSVSYGSLGGQLASGKESWRVKNYAIHMGISKDARKLADHVELLNGTMQDHIQNLNDYLIHHRDNRVCKYNGAGSNRLPVNKSLDLSGKEAAERHYHSIASMEIGKSEIRTIAALAKEKGFRLLLFTTPAWSSYTSRLDSAQLRTTITYCEKLAASDPTVEYLDLLDDPRFLDPDFADADHLSASGQAKLSFILGSWIRELDADNSPVTWSVDTVMR